MANSSRNEIAVLDLATLEVLRRLETGRVPDGMAWIPGPEAPDELAAPHPTGTR